MVLTLRVLNMYSCLYVNFATRQTYRPKPTSGIGPIVVMHGNLPFTRIDAKYVKPTYKPIAPLVISYDEKGMQVNNCE
jgi:hypothetical protein